MSDAMYFDSGANRLFGWYHGPPKDKAASFGIVICKPFGYEAICAHSGMRAFSDATASLGAPTLQFDFAGTGDSSEIEPEANQLEIWIEDTLAAIREVRRLGGVPRVYLLGFRLGALVAALAAGRDKAVSGLILIAPVISGTRFLRVLRTMRLAASLDLNTRSPESKFVEISGFLLSTATLAALSDVDLRRQGLPPSSEILVIDGDSMPRARAWSEELCRTGVNATYLALPGMVEMLMTAPQFASVPTGMISAMRDWLRQRPDRTLLDSNDYNDRDLNRQVTMLTAMTLASPDSAGRATITESPVILTPECPLFGIVTEPATGNACGRALILANAGADYHIGASGIYVTLARHLARRGYVVLRMDLRGIGDSSTWPGRPDNEVFPPRALDDIAIAVEWMRARYVVGDITIGGLCSGAYHALQAAIRGLPVNRAMIVNPETYFWSEEKSILDRQQAELVSQPGAYRTKLLSTTTWKRLVRGQIDVGYVLGTCTARLAFTFESWFLSVMRRLRIRVHNDLAWQIEDTAARGVQLTFIFSRGEPGIALLEMQAGISLHQLGERCHIHIIDNADHVFSKLEARMTLQRILTEELNAPRRRLH